MLGPSVLRGPLQMSLYWCGSGYCGVLCVTGLADLCAWVELKGVGDGLVTRLIEANDSHSDLEFQR